MNVGPTQGVKVTEKKEKLESLIGSFEKLPFVLLTETWLCSYESNMYLPFANLFNILRCDRSDRRKGGGVVIMIPKCYRVFLLARESSIEYDSVWCKIISENCSLRVGLIYRCPTNFDSMPAKLLEHLEVNNSTNEPTVIFGDFNYPKIDWDNTTASDAKQQLFLEYVIGNGLEQLVNFSTRNNNILDLVISNEPGIVQCLSLGPEIDGCDHNTILGFFIHQEAKSKTMSIRNYKGADYTEFNCLLANLDWVDIFKEIVDVETIWQIFLSILSFYVDVFIPTCTFTKTKNCNFSKKVSKLCKKVYKLHKKWKRTEDQNVYQNYLEASALCQREKRLDTFTYERRICNSKDRKKLWGYLKQKLSYKSDLPCILSNEGDVVGDSFLKAQLFNKYFASVFISDDGNSPNWDFPESTYTLTNITFTPEIVYKKLINLEDKLSCGPDMIPPILLKRLAVPLAEPLSIIFQSSFETSTLPADWLKANVRALFKKGNENSVNNYRPISLTSVCCKTMEAILCDSIKDHVKPQIFEGQHGFLSGKSTVTQLIETLEEWTKSIDEGYYVDVLYIDIAKAFDTVSHEKLLSKLHRYGIQGKVLAWIKAFLSNRTQQVIVDSSFSETISVISGVAQGSGMGPTLFLLYINPLPLSIVNAKTKLFADDCKLYVAFKRDQNFKIQEMQDDINRLVEWCKTSQLKIAFSKCAILHLGYNNPRNIYYFDTDPIESVSSIRDLGVTVSDNLKFHEHIKSIVKSATATSNLIHKCFVYKDPTFLTQMYTTFVRPKIEYASQVWNPQYTGDTNLLEKVQRRYTKRIPGMNDLNYSARLERLGLISLELRRIHLDLTFLYKLLNGMLEMNYQQFFQLKNSITRGHQLTLYKPKAKKQIRTHFFSIRIINIWNSLPTSVALAQNLETFKKLLCTDTVIQIISDPTRRFLRGED